MENNPLPSGAKRSTVYLTQEAWERKELLPNFSDWVCNMLMKHVNQGGIMAPTLQDFTIQKNIQYFCVKCNSWVQTPRCPLCGFKSEKREAGELRI